MATPENLDALIDTIFVEDQINSSQLKEFLKLLSVHLKSSDGQAYSEGVAGETETGEYEEIAQAQYLSELITECEQRLEKLTATPKTRIVIRNEGEKLSTIMAQLECIKTGNSGLQGQIDDLKIAQKKFKSLECERRQKFQNMIDRLYPTSMNSDVCNLRRMYFGLQEQVDELIVKTDNMQKDIMDIQTKIKALDAIPVLEEKVAVLMDWRGLMQDELEHFVERYEHLKTVKASKCEVEDMLKEKVDYCHLVKYVQKITFEAAQEEFITEFKELKELFCDLQIFLCAKLVALHKDVQLALNKLASKRRLEKRSI